MNKNNTLAKEVPSTTSSFQIETTGKLTKKRYLGDFVCVIPNLKMQGMIAKYEATLNGDMPQFLPPGILNLHKRLAYLRYTLTEFPKFWKDSDLGIELMDMNIIEDVYDKVMDAEEKWMKTMWGEAEEQNDGKEA